MLFHLESSGRSSLLKIGTFVVLGTSIFLAGCASTALPPGRSVLDVADAKTQDPLAYLNQPVQPVSSETGFVWEKQVLSGTGQGTAPAGMPGVQADMAATNAARVQALTQVQDQMKKLPVGTDQTVGTIMHTYLPIRRAIEQELSQAQVVSQQPTASGVQVQVNLSMENVARILHQHNITTDQELPARDTRPANVPDII